MTEREQRAALADYFERERVRLGLRRDEHFEMMLGELRTGINCQPTPGETCRFCGKRLKWSASENRVLCELPCPGAVDGAPSVAEFEEMAGLAAPTANEMAETIRDLIAHGCGCHRYRNCPHVAARKLLARLDAARKAGG